MIKFSIITPVYQCASETEEFLESLTRQRYDKFEIIILEDGERDLSEPVVKKYHDKLDIKYYYKKNTSVSERRNFGMQVASGDYFIFFDSDCIIPENYLTIVNAYQENTFVEAYGGPDRAMPSFSAIQKAVNYSMTSFFTTGGIRGGKKQIDNYHPRSFNMGVSRKLYKKIGGFPEGIQPGEDIIYSIRIRENANKVVLLEDAFVYHKRKTSLPRFYKQIHSFAYIRYPIGLIYPKSRKLFFFLPSVYVLGMIFLVLMSLLVHPLFIVPIAIHYLAIFVDALYKEKDIKVALLSIVTSFTQFIAYGFGFFKSIVTCKLLGEKEFLKSVNFTQLNAK